MLPLEGTRAVELGMWVAAPTAATVLAEWGAEVTKAEAPAGDPMRRFFGQAAGVDLPETPPSDLDNRGKSSVLLDLHTDTGREQFEGHLAEADVFLTNLRPSALATFGLEPETVLARHPRLVYAAITGYGRAGDDAEVAAYDLGAFWARSGLAAAHTPDGDPPVTLRPGVGDRITAMNLVAGIAAALYQRERTGRGQLVETSLFRSGIYANGYDLSLHLRWGTAFGTPSRGAAPNPLVNSYRRADGRWLWLLGVQSDRHWAPLLRALDRATWANDEQFATAMARAVNAAALVVEAAGEVGVDEVPRRRGSTPGTIPAGWPPG